MSELIADYDYLLPPESIAQAPLREREASRMLVATQHALKHEHFSSLPDYVKAGDLVVVNDTQVIPARLWAQKPSGGRVEILLLKPVDALEWQAFLSPWRGLKVGGRLSLSSRGAPAATAIQVQVSRLDRDDARVRFASVAELEAAWLHYGEMPLPPYIRREAPRSEDSQRYQSIFAQKPGAVAAPTASLHFSPEIRAAMLARGAEWASLTLHVGAGTFLPVKVENLNEHPMHEEYYEIPESTSSALAQCRARGGRILVVGTTALRALESYGLTGALSGRTRLMIRPGFDFKYVDALLTNFHQPRSTLLVLVSALLGRERVLAAYREAVERGYRFLSYGDCMLIQVGPAFE